MDFTYLINLDFKVMNGMTQKIVDAAKQKDKFFDSCTTYPELIKKALGCSEPNWDFDEWENGTYTSSFNGGYGYQRILDSLFNAALPYIEDGSYVDAYPDNGFYRIVKEHGEKNMYIENEEINPVFDTVEDLLDMLEGNPYGFYNEKTNYYLIEYHDNILIFQLPILKARELAAKARAKETEALKKGKRICISWYDVMEAPKVKESIATDSPEVLRILQDYLDDDAYEDWILASPCADFFALYVSDEVAAFDIDAVFSKFSDEDLKGMLKFVRDGHTSDKNIANKYMDTVNDFKAKYPSYTESLAWRILYKECAYRWLGNC